MKTKKYNWILYFISVTILVTIAVQFYWNYRNYQENKRRVLNDIQMSLNNSIEEYFSKISKEIILAKNGLDTAYFNQREKNTLTLDSLTGMHGISGLTINRDSIQKGIINPDSIFANNLIQEVRVFSNNAPVVSKGKINFNTWDRISDSTSIPQFLKGSASYNNDVLRGLKTVFVAITSGNIDFNKLDSLFKFQLTVKGITGDYYMDYYNKDSIVYSTKKDVDVKYPLSIKSNSTYLGHNRKLIANYTDPTITALKKSSTGILLSLLLSLMVIYSLFYLLRTVNRQKELAEIKNDLISNITHEFKTPIATVSTAIEAIENFNVINDKEKTQKYLSMSSVQLKKLNIMVEKLLETATIDSEKLMLKREETDIVDLINRLSGKHQMLSSDKEIIFNSLLPSLTMSVDAFHFENAISNLIDNAVKYGGNRIEVNVNLVLDQVEISVADNGKGIEKSQQEKIFDKFYRIPKGNTHDVKGFGIGLYYTKKIIEKHHGTIGLISNNQNTLFKILIPNE